MTMDESAFEPRLTPQSAVQTLQELGDYEETLTARAFGVTLIAFGIAGGATTMTYAHVSDWFVAAGLPWLLSFLWLPWILAAGLLTAIVWHTQSVTLPTLQAERGSWVYFVVFSLLYMGLLGGVAYADHTWSLGIGAANHNLVTLAFFTALIALVFHVRHGASWMLGTMYVVAGTLALAAFVLSGLDLDREPATLLAVMTGLITWVGAGTFIAMRG